MKSQKKSFSPFSEGLKKVKGIKDSVNETIQNVKVDDKLQNIKNASLQINSSVKGKVNQALDKVAIDEKLKTLKESRLHEVVKEATADASTWKIIGGVALGVGAVAAVPFTGGGSIVGATALAASLAGTTAAVSAVAAGGIGGTAAYLLDKKDKNEQEEAEKNRFKEGVLAGSAKTKEKFYSILKEQKKRDEFLLLTIKIGVHVAKCDGVFDESERRDIEGFKGKVSASPAVPQLIKDRIDEIIQSEIPFDEVVKDMHAFIQNETPEFVESTKKMVDELIEQIIFSDGVIHEKEEEFFQMWHAEFS